MSRLIAALLLIALASPAGAETLQAQIKSWPVAAGSRLRFDFPVGDLRVEPGDDTHVRLELEVRCKRWSRDECQRRAAKLSLDVDQSPSELSVKIVGYPKYNSNGFNLHGTLYVPRSLDLHLAMGVGDFELDGHRGDLQLELGVGDADVTLDPGSYRSADVEVGVGDASLRAGGKRRSSSGFIGRSVSWDDGPGASRARVHVGVGEARVRIE